MRSTRAILRHWVAGALILTLGGGGRVALAQPSQSASQPPVHLTGDQEAEGAWRRPVFWSAVGLTSAGLLGAIYFRARYNTYIKDFNSFTAPAPGGGQNHCAVNAANNGPTGCAHILHGANNAKGLAKVSLAVAGGAALTALVVKVTEPERLTHGAGTRNRTSSQWAVACTPLAAAGVTCGLTF